MIWKIFLAIFVTSQLGEALSVIRPPRFPGRIIRPLPRPPPGFNLPVLPPPVRPPLPPAPIRPPPLPFPTRIVLPPITRPPIKYDHDVIVPKALRIGATEKVVLNLYEYTSATVNAFLQELPGRQNVFSQTAPRTLNAAACKQPIELNVVVNDNNIQNFRTNQQVELVIEVGQSGHDFTERIPVDVTKQSGYLFIQTDRPIYRPGESVEVRVIPLEQDMSPEKENLIEILIKTPDGIGAAKYVQRLPNFGFPGAIFAIAENPMLGTWSVQATYLSKGYNTTSEVDFVIRKYVLPTFNVKIEMTKNFFFPTDITISGYIRANYSYGEAVNGNYFLTLKLKKTPTSDPIVFYKMPGAGSYLETAYFEDGEYKFEIPMDEISSVLNEGETLHTLADNFASIFVEATVNSHADGVLESDISADLPILKNPYSIDLSKTNKYYIPGLSYVLMADIRDITTGEPASGIRVRVTVGNSASSRSVTSNSAGEITAPISFTGSGSQSISIVTNLDDVEDEDQTTTSFSVLPYSSPSSSYLRISLPEEPASVGENYFISFDYIPTAPEQIRYLILSRGAILSSGINNPNSGSSQSSQMIPVTQSMVPAFRIVAYYKNNKETISASVWVDVVDQCKQELTMDFPEQVLPGATLPVTIRGAPNAMVAMNGVDKAAYFLHKQDRLTRDVMFGSMSAYDEGCVRSGGSTAKNVFEGAGLKTRGLTSSDGRSPCEGSASSRKKRDIDISASDLEKGLRQCTRDGMRENLAGETCNTRGIRCRDNYEYLYPGCWRRFRTACFRAERERRRKASMNITMTGSEADAEASVERRRSAFQDEDETITATIITEPSPPVAGTSTESEAAPVPPPVAPKPLPPAPAPAPLPIPPARRPGPGLFGQGALRPGVESHIPRPEFEIAGGGIPERPVASTTIATTTTTLAPTPVTGLRRSDFNEGLSWPARQLASNGRVFFSRRVRDSITTFIFDAVGMHDSADGFCVAPPAELRVFKEIFVQLNTPFSLKKQEQAELRIVVFNYNRQSSQDVVVRVRTDAVYCTRFKADTWTELRRMSIPAGGSGSASLSVFPLRIPLIERAPIEVEIRTPDNRLLDSVEKHVLIEPEGEVKDTYQSYPLDLKSTNHDSFQISLRFPEEFVPGTRQCWLYGYTNFLGPSIEVNPTTMEPRDIKDIFRMPYGCGEQNMLVTGPNVYAHMYLKAVGKLLPGSLQLEQSITRIQDGFNRQLQYRSERVGRRAWAVFAHYAPSTWLNAYVDRVFIKGSTFYTDMDLKPICDSLEWLLGEQINEGSFRELRPPIHREMHGAVGGRYTLTAYVLITLVDGDGVCSSQLTQNLTTVRNRAVAFLQSHKNETTFQRSYALSLLTYALSLHNPRSAFAREMNARLLGLKQYTNDRRQVFWQGHPANDVAGTDVHPYWYNRRPQAIDVEATSYALLAQIEFAKAKTRLQQSDLDLTRQIVLWLISQRNEAGAFRSTQDTVVGLQALATYQIWVNQVDPQPDTTSIDITLTSADTTSWSAPLNQYKFLLDDTYEGFRKEIDIPNDVMLSSNISVNASGNGEGVLSYRCVYRTVVDEDGCHFQVNHNIEIINEGSDNGPPMTIKLTITVSKPVGAQAEQSIIEVSLLTGFVPVESTLLNLAVADVVDGTVERYEVTSQNVILYMNRIDSNPVSFAFLMEQSVKADNYQPAKINIYDYYEPSVKCGIFYALPGQLAHLRTANCDIGNDEVCQCAEGVCPVCRTRDELLENTTCLTTFGAACETCANARDCYNMYVKACNSNFAYIVNITYSPDISPTTVFASFTAEIIEVLKLGNDYVDRNAERTFITRTDCYGLCQDPTLIAAVKSDDPADSKFLREGFPIMIIGDAPVQGYDRNGNTEMRYLLGKGAVLERIIPDHRCERTLRDIDKDDLKCDNPTFPRSANKEARCVRLKKFRESCANLQRLKALLREGCG